VRSYPEATTFLRHLEEHGAGPADDPNGKRVRAELTTASPEMRQMFFDELEQVMAHVARLKSSAPRRPEIAEGRSRPRSARARRRAGTRVRGSPERRSGGDDPPDDVDDSLEERRS
jgi:hypothetical protein